MIRSERSLKIRVGIFVISHEKSPQFLRADKICADVIDSLSDSGLNLEFNVKTLSWQPDSSLPTYRSYFKYQRVKFRSYRSWFKFGVIQATFRVLVFEIKSLFLGRSQLQISKQLIYVATVVTQKNVRAWESIVDLGLEAAFVFEDDAVLNLESNHVLSAAIREISTERPTFVNLAKGNDLNPYKINHLRSKLSETEWGIAPIADTGCAYLLNIECAKILLNQYRGFLKYDSLAIDFILSDIFISRKDIMVLHHVNPPFINGSLFGAFKSQTGAVIRKDF